MKSLDENPNCAKTYASFRLIGDALDTDVVTRALNREPDLALTKGQELPSGLSGKPRRQLTGIWSLSSRDAISSTSLERHLLHLLDDLEPATSALHELTDAEGVRADFFCYWLSATGDGGPEISADTLGRIAALRASLGIDFYGPF